MNIKCILLNEKHQNEQATYCVVPFTFHYVKRKTEKPISEKQTSDCQGFDKGKA